MAIISLKFALFVLATVIIFYLLPGKAQNPFLLIASYYYYSTWAWDYVIVLLALTIFNFFYAQLLQRSQARRKLVLWGGVGANLAVFFFYLFSDLLPKFASRAGLPSFELAILMPVGFSYYILQCISYLLDINLKIARPTQNFIDFALYLAYFPKLISGPIERARKFLPMLTEKRLVDNQVFARSFMLVMTGLVRSVILGGLLSFLAPSVFADPEKFTKTELLVGMIVWAFFLYNQFAGYTDIVRGVSGFFGIELSRNFAYPFFSKDFSDFWKRWHISLSSWLRDYIYLPLSRSLLRKNPSRNNKANLIIPPLATMLASGLWHGASWSLLLWGALNGLFIVAENFLNLNRPTAPAVSQPWWRRVISRLVLISLALFAAVPFALNLPDTLEFYNRLIFAGKWTLPNLNPLPVIIVSLLLDWYQSSRNDEFVFLKWPRLLQASSAALALILVIIVYNLQNAPTTFIYP
jgi:D-alanyl-lipoteichoic acid acyltransferase DltB (MBOAT superfamily)